MIPKERKTIKLTVTKSYEFTHCYHACPYFGLDGGPGAVMVCNHPDADSKWSGGGDAYKGFGIISHPDCDEGFPEHCPLRGVNGEIIGA